MSTISTTTTSDTTTTTTVDDPVSTSIAPEATSYAACQPNNLVYGVDGQDALYGIGTPYTFSDDQTVTSPYDCCVSCITTPDCGGAAFFPGDGCYTYTDGGTCSATQITGGFSSMDSATMDATISNAYCGQFVYDGDT